MTPSCRIRIAVPEDAPAIARLSDALGYGASGNDNGQALAALIDRSDHVVFVAEDEAGAVIGWIHAFLALRLASESFVEVGGLVVGEESRRRGAGRALLRAVSDWSRDQGCLKIRVRVNAKREEAHRFYIRVGYEQVKDQQVFEFRLENAPDMVRVRTPG
jgi:GNAT superfamily N-acetyltransferase